MADENKKSRRGNSFNLPSDLVHALLSMEQQGFNQEKQNIAVTEKSTETKKIIIPATMDKLQASQELERQYEEEETVVNLFKDFENWEFKDVLAAIKRAAEKHFGWVNGKTTKHWWGTTRPSFIEIVTNIVDGEEITEECFYGEMTISGWDNASMDIKIRSASHVQVVFEVKKKFNEEVKEFFALINKELKENSIYRGKSVVITQSQRGGVEYTIFENKPSSKIFFNEEQQMLMDDFVMPDIMDEGKRTYLFTGDYGTGKTEKAMEIGKTANDAGMSFIYLKDSQLLNQVILLCNNYEPCVLFLEDLDEVASGERGSDINHILNTLDGVETKRNNVKIIFTTNHEEKINSAFRRPGRIDLIVKFEYPDNSTKVKICESWLSDLEGYAGLDMAKCIGYLPDAQGAVIAEIAKRIRRLSIKNSNKVIERYFKSAALSIEPQIELMKAQAQVTQPTLESTLVDVLKKTLQPLAWELGVEQQLKEV